jgi:hypothetical protein
MNDVRSSEFAIPADTDPAAIEAAQAKLQIGALKAWFRRYPELHCLLVVDPSQRALLAPEAAADSPFADMPRAEVVVNHDAFVEAHRPYLLQLDLSTVEGIAALDESVRLALEDRRPKSMVQGNGQRIGGWLASSVSLHEVAAHFSHLAIQRDERGRLCLLRFYDSRAQALLWPMLTPEQQRALLGPIRAWHTFDASTVAVARSSMAGPRDVFALTDAQWQAVRRHGIVNVALAQHAYACDRQPTAHEVDIAVAAAVRAERYGLADRNDLIAFINHALAWHPEFDRHPLVLSILSRRADGDFYTADIGQLSESDIAEIQQGAWYERLHSLAAQ